MATGEGITLPLFDSATGFTDGDFVYMSQAGKTVKGTIAQLKDASAVNATAEIFVPGDGVAPGTYLPGAATLQLAGIYGSINNLDIYADAAPQLDCTLTGNAPSGDVLGFPNGGIPAGLSKLIVRGQMPRPIGTPSDATIGDAMIAPGSRLYNRINNTVDVRDFPYLAKGDGVTDDTAAIQAAITSVANNGGTLVFSPGRYLCGSLKFNSAKGGVICAQPGTVFLLPKANNVVFFTVTNSTIGKPAVIDGIGFDNTALKTGVSALSIDKFYMFQFRNVIALHLQYIVAAAASTQNSYNLLVDNVLMFGTGSFHYVATAPNYIFGSRITNVAQFTGGGDVWSDAFLTFQRCVNLTGSEINISAMSGSNTGLHIIGDCQGIFLDNTIIVQPTTGLIADNSNGDAAVPSYLYFDKFAIDQPTVTGASILARAVKMTDSNFTFGSDQNNTGVGMQLLTGSSDLTFQSVRVESMYHDGLQIQGAIPDVRFIDCFLNTNGVSGSGFDLDMISSTPRNPTFRDCDIGTSNLNGSVYVINGGATSRYAFSQRTSVTSSVGASNQVLATVNLPGGTLVDGKTLRISTSGLFASNANLKSLTLTVGGITVASMSGMFNGTSFVAIGEVFRVDSNDAVIVGDTRAGSTVSVTSAVQSPFNSAAGLTVTLLCSGVGASDIVMHRFDVELID